MSVEISWLPLLPVLGPALAAVLVLVVDLVLPGRRGPLGAVAGLGLLVGVAGAVVGRLADDARSLCPPPGASAAGSTCLVDVSPAGSTLQAVTLLAAGAALALLLAARGAGDSLSDDASDDASDDVAVVAGVLAGAAGAAVTLGARDLGSWLVGLELATLPFVAVLALRSVRARGSAALDLLVTAVLSFALAALGAGLWVMSTGTLLLDGTTSDGTALGALAEPERAALTAASVLLVLAAGFKLALVPVHLWAPLSYERGGPAVATALTGVSVTGGLGAILVVVEAVGRAGLPGPRLALGVLAAVSLVLGAVMAWRQDDLLRLVAWSGVTQGGWVAAAASVGGSAPAAGYLAVYVVAVVAVLAAVAATGTRLVDHTGLLRRDPLVGLSLAAGLLALAGLPPALVGLLAKVVVLDAVVTAGSWWLAGAAVVGAVVALAVYLRWLAVALRPVPTSLVRPDGAGSDLADDLGDDAVEVVTGRRGAAPVVALVAAALVVVTSLAPGLLL
ncbi:proton-conducting transporter transmembrane domain-containing protein [Janibacter melonis]|uniref:proton-conducting transporter transmembrane domain-containing protein n=1 Tax=Janibacter melonis TaxID=262209 RepID=UPI001749E028|nr:proton-conducting transporter membrane subunit [Janibacter melonis]